MSAFPYWRLVFGAILAFVVILAPGGLMGLLLAARDGRAPCGAMILEARDVPKFYGDFCALDGVSLGIRDGEFVSIIGPNGAGKSTLVNVLTGACAPTSGTVRFKERDIAGIGPVALARLGMARSFQLVHIFPDLTVLETLQAAVVSRLGRGTRLFAVARAATGRCRTAPSRSPSCSASPTSATSLARQLAPGRQEAARRRLGVRAAAGDHPARRADERRLHGATRRRSWRCWSRRPGASGCRRSSRSSTTWTSSSATPTGSSPSTRAGSSPTATPDGHPARRGGGRRRRSVGRPRRLMLRGRGELDVYIQASHILRRVSLEVGARRGRLPGRPERRREDDHAPHDHGLPAAAPRGAIEFRGGDSTGAAPTRSPGSASAGRPRTAASSRT